MNAMSDKNTFACYKSSSSGENSSSFCFLHVADSTVNTKLNSNEARSNVEEKKFPYSEKLFFYSSALTSLARISTEHDPREMVNKKCCRRDALIIDM